MTDEINTEAFNASDVGAEVEAQKTTTKAELLANREALLFAAKRADGNIEVINAALLDIQTKLAALDE
jgi:hypothetical protein